MAVKKYEEEIKSLKEEIKSKNTIYKNLRKMLSSIQKKSLDDVELYFWKLDYIHNEMRDLLNKIRILRIASYLNHPESEEVNA